MARMMPTILRLLGARKDGVAEEEGEGVEEDMGDCGRRNGVL